LLAIALPPPPPPSDAREDAAAGSACRFELCDDLEGNRGERPHSDRSTSATTD